jgi:hypothetical protein
LGRPDAQVFLRVGAVRRDLRRCPFPGAADIRPDAESLLDADHDVAHRLVYFGMVAVVVPGPPVRQDLMAVGAEKLAVLELSRLAGVVPERLEMAALSLERPASDAAVASAELRVSASVLELYKPDAAQSAA